jgi:hypothetical protein
LLALLNHPWLMDSEVEHLAAIGFESQTLRDLRDRIVALYYEGRAPDRETLHHELQRSGHAGTVARIGEANMRGLDLDACPSASREDVQRGWHDRLAMQRKTVELPAELEAAERGLAAEFTEQQYSACWTSTRSCTPPAMAPSRRLLTAWGSDESRSGPGRPSTEITLMTFTSRHLGMSGFCCRRATSLEKLCCSKAVHSGASFS